MNMRAHRAYAATQRETAVSSARPIDLVVMVYERLLDHLRSAQLQMAAGTDPQESLTKALELITTGLESCLDMARGGEIAQNLAAIYEWASRDILLARLRRDPQLIQGVIDAMSSLAQAWRQHAGLTDEVLNAPAAPLTGAASRPLAAAMA
jgi:flagellar secretion chaperone FliS